MSRSDHGSSPEDLSARSRRGLLSEAEERELVQALAEDPVLRAAHTVGLDLDRSTAVRAGDEALVARVADAALSRVAASGLSPKQASEADLAARSPLVARRRPRQLAILLAAALIFASGVAAGVWSGVVPARWFEPLAKEGGSTRATAPLQVNRVLRPRQAALAAPHREESSDALDLAVDPAAQGGASVIPRARPSHTVTEATAAEMFRAGNVARRGGDFSRAKSSYSELIAKYPTSDEASIARVSLGKLLLAKGDPSAAEQEFSRYLKGGRGQLAEEALVSRAQSLQKMGRAEAERLTWQRLLAEYPKSVYSAEARTRLRILRRGE